MSLNRVIGAGGKIPWHIPEDFRWFKKMTTGNIVVMGRKTYESIGRALPNRFTILISKSQKAIPGLHCISSLGELDAAANALGAGEVFICGGAQLYEQALPFCSNLYLTIVKRVVAGDVFFPPFEHRFKLIGELLDQPEFKICHYQQPVT